MVSVKHIVLFTLILVVPLPSHSRPDLEHSGADRNSLYAQSAAEALNSDFPDAGITFLLLDAHSGRVLASRWQYPNAPIPLGSLAKPFAALAYGEHHGFHFPAHHCRGFQSGCWRPAGHGDVDLTSAISYSCNSYFRFLTADLTAAEVSPTASRFGLNLPDPEISGPELAGLGSRWRISPLHMARGYLQLLDMRDKSGVHEIIAGMERSARQGTGAEVDRALRFGSALVKTGTAACTHDRHAPGDGFALALVPADQPRILLLVRAHGVPGSHAAKTAGQMLRRIGE